MNSVEADFRLLRGYFIEYLLSRPEVKAVWSQFVNHPFVMAMGDGSLPVESFKGYIVQDYLYLVIGILSKMLLLLTRS